jgi:integrase
LHQAIESLPSQGKKVFHFVTPNGKPVCLVTASARVRKLARACGVKLTYKTLRQGFGCRYAAKVPAQVLQRLMRHASIKTTCEYYVNVNDAVFEAILGPGRNSKRNNRQSSQQVQVESESENPLPEGTLG